MLPRRAVSAASHRLEGAGEERRGYGRGWPSAHTPRPSTARRERLKTALRPQPERMARREDEAGGFGLRTHGPTAGERAQSARAILPVDQEQHGTEQHYGFLKAPVLVKRRLLQTPERIAAWGLLLLLALRLWRLMARTMRTSGDTTRTPWPGWAKQAPERPTAFLMITQWAGVSVCTCGHARPLTRPLSVVPQP